MAQFGRLRILRPMSSDSLGAYPQDREAEVTLRDGSTVHVRPVRPDDKVAIREFLEGVSPESIGFRFFGAIDLAWVTAWALTVDYADRFALVAETGSPRRIIAHAAYIRIKPALPEGGTSGIASIGNQSSAEIAFLVADAWQGRGISTLLLAHLAAVAERHGIATFWAMVLPSNHRMIDVFRGSGFPVDLRSTPDAIHVELPTSLSEEAVARFDERERLAAIAAVRRFLEPSSVAVIGASRREDSVGGRILHNILASEFAGTVYAVNEHADVVQSLPAYRSVADIPAPVELAVVVVRAERVVTVARECAAARVRALLVISAGFAEMGEQGARRQHELLAVCRAAGMRVIGPNCLGVINTAEAVRLNATFAPDPATPGRVGFMSQSGGLGIAIIEAAGRAGVRTFVVCIRWQQGGSVGQRHAPLLGAGPEHRPCPALPRVVRRPAQVRSHGSPRCPAKAADRGQERTLGRGRARHELAYRSIAVGLRRDSGRAVSSRLG